MSLELGVYSFGNTPRTPGNGYGPTAQAVRDVLEPVKLAEDAGLDFFGFGEHHSRSMPLSSPTSLVTAAAASTGRIQLGTTVTVLSTDEPLRVFQQLATAAAIAPGRIEIAGAAGIVLGLWVAPLGIAAAVGLVAYFVGAVAGHLRVRDLKNVAMPLPPLVLAIAVLVLRLTTA
jgi:Luciferase-like monooxygenase/DoxX-like family